MMRNLCYNHDEFFPPGVDQKKVSYQQHDVTKKHALISQSNTIIDFVHYLAQSHAINACSQSRLLFVLVCLS